jgi:hypothetical protein
MKETFRKNTRINGSNKPLLCSFFHPKKCSLGLVMFGVRTLVRRLSSASEPKLKKMNMVTAINDALRIAMETQPNVDSTPGSA